MFINKIGYDHLQYGMNCQDYGLELDDFKLVCDGCSEGLHTEVGAKLFCYMMKYNINISEAFYKLAVMFGNTVDDMKNYLCFTTVYAYESIFSFILKYCGDGYVILEDIDGNITFEELTDGEYPKYYIYNYIDKKHLKHYAEGISVIDNKNVIIPRTINSWAGLSPELIDALKAIFENRSRELHSEIHELYNHLKFCNVDKDYYYDRYSVCPVCDSSAKINKKPISQGVQSGLQLIEMLVKNCIKLVINENMYIDKDNYIVNIHTGKKVKYKNLIKYHFHPDDILIEESNESFVIHSNKDYEFDKKYKTSIIVEDDKLYYISKQNTLTEVTITRNGNSIKNVCKCSNSCYFEISHGKYFVINYYHGKIVFNNNGMNCIYNYDGAILNYGIHYDELTCKWLVVIENEKNKFLVFVFCGNEIQYECDRIKFDCSLGNMCINNSTLFFPMDGKIRGFAYQKDLFKDFQCSAVNNDSKLIKSGKKFIIINDENIYSLS